VPSFIRATGEKNGWRFSRAVETCHACCGYQQNVRERGT
jgi:hypothetical protein